MHRHGRATRHDIATKQALRRIRRNVILTMILYTALVISTPCDAFVCLQPYTSRSRVNLELLYYIRSSPDSPEVDTFSCWLPSDGTVLSPDLKTIEMSFDIETHKEDDSQDFVDLSGADSEEEVSKMRFWSFFERFQELSETLRWTPLTLKSLLKSYRDSQTVLSQRPKSNDMAQSTDTIPTRQPTPDGFRWATADQNVDLSGTWKPIMTQQFKNEYDLFLANCNVSYLLRKVMVNGVALQKERIEQRSQGRELELYAMNPAGAWNRTLLASGSEVGFESFDPVHVKMVDPDGDEVEVEAWWEDDGTVHKSWLRGKEGFQGGVVESSRYLEDDNTLVCESTFHPGSDVKRNGKFQQATLVWKFERIE